MRTVIEYIAEFFAIISGIVLVTLVTLTSIDIMLASANKVSRVFSLHISSITGYEDIVVLQIVTAVFLMMPYCQLHLSHINLTFFTTKFPTVIQKLLDGFWLLTLLVLVVFLLIQMLFGLVETKYEGLTTSVLGIKIWPFYISAIISLLFWGLVVLMQFYELLTKGQIKISNKRNYHNAI